MYPRLCPPAPTAAAGLVLSMMQEIAPVLDYYAILEVDPDATQDEIRLAYRRRARACHPDRIGADARPFQNLQQAYATLADPRQRRAYDRALGQQPRVAVHAASGRAHHGPVEPLIPARRPARGGRDISLADALQTLGPSLEELTERLTGGFVPAGRRRSAPVERLAVEVPLSAAQAAAGGTVLVRVPASRACAACRGRGGTGPFVCWHCAGTGRMDAEVPVEVAFPAGIRRDHSVRVSLAELGATTLYLEVVFRPSAGSP